MLWLHKQQGQKSGKQRWQHEEGGGGGGDGAGHSGETVDYESHQVINDFINKTDHAAVIAVTRAEGWSAPSAPFQASLPPCSSNIASLCQRQGNAKERKKRGAGCSWGWREEGVSHEGGSKWRGGRRGRKKSENPFWNPFSIRGPQAVITGVPEWGPVSENVSYPFLKWNLIWEAQRWRGQRICKLLSIPAVNGNFISVRWHSPLFTVDHLNGCLKRRRPLTLPLSPPSSPSSLYHSTLSAHLKIFFLFFQCSQVLLFFFKHFSHALHLLGDFCSNLHESLTFVAL